MNLYEVKYSNNGKNVSATLIQENVNANGWYIKNNQIFIFDEDIHNAIRRFEGLNIIMSYA